MSFPSQTHFPLMMIDHHRHVPQHRSQLHHQRGRNCCLRFRQGRLHLLRILCRWVFDSFKPIIIVIFVIWILVGSFYIHTYAGSNATWRALLLPESRPPLLPVLLMLSRPGKDGPRWCSMFLLFRLMTNISCLFYCKFLNMTNLGGQVHERRARSVSRSPPLCQSHFQNWGRQVSRLNYCFYSLGLEKIQIFVLSWTVRWSDLAHFRFRIFAWANCTTSKSLYNMFWNVLTTFAWNVWNCKHSVVLEDPSEFVAQAKHNG